MGKLVVSLRVHFSVDINQNFQINWSDQNSIQIISILSEVVITLPKLNFDQSFTFNLWIINCQEH